MSVTAMQWVWDKATARGNVRLVLLAVADKAPGPDCTARIGTTEMLRRVNAARSSVIAAIDKAIESGELAVIEAAAGSRAALYQLPAAVGYLRITGPETGPLEGQGGGSENRTPKPSRSGNRTPKAPATGPETGPLDDTSEMALWSENRTPRGPETGPHHAPIERGSERGSDGAPAPTDIPDFARPLTDAIGRAGHNTIRWSLTSAEWFLVQELINRSGAPALAAFAIDQAGRRRVGHGRYFLAGWRELAPAPAAGSDNVIPLATAPSARPAAGGWQPFQCPPPDAYANDKGF